jgi:hypothetical protein
LLWRHITKARQLLSTGVKSTCLLNIVNIRRRLEPPLAFEYPGNAIVYAETSAGIADVESEKSLYKLAQQIGDSIDWWTSEKIWYYIEAIESTAHVGKV